MKGIFRYTAVLVAFAALLAAAIYSESAAQTKTPLQICNEKFANVKGVAKSNVIQACVDEMSKTKGK